MPQQDATLNVGPLGDEAESAAGDRLGQTGDVLEFGFRFQALYHHPLREVGSGGDYGLREYFRCGR